MIDNGGLRYFFEEDFPGTPPYDTFVKAYREIGAEIAAQALTDAVGLFPFKNPNKAKNKRNEFLDSFNDEDDEPVNSPFEPLTKILCGSLEVWARLESYIIVHSKLFDGE